MCAPELVKYGGGDAGGQGDTWLLLLLSMILPTDALLKGGIIAERAASCMRDLVASLFSAEVSRNLGRDSGLVIRSRGRWGKCG